VDESGSPLLRGDQRNMGAGCLLRVKESGKERSQIWKRGDLRQSQGSNETNERKGDSRKRSLSRGSKGIRSSTHEFPRMGQSRDQGGGGKVLVKTRGTKLSVNFSKTGKPGDQKQ